MSILPRTARRSLVAALALLCVAVVASTSSAVAATTVKRDRWQVFTSVGPRLQDDGGNLFRVTPAVDRFQLGTTRWIVTWDNFSSVARTQALSLRAAAEPGAGALLDRALTAAELRRFNQRVLWYEAEVLAAHPSNPVCASGLTRAQAVGILDGTATDWTALVPAGTWQMSDAGPDVHGYRPTARPGGYLEPYFGVSAFGAGLHSLSDSGRRAAVALDPNAVAPMHYSLLRGRTDVCAVPIDGVRPDDTTVRAATYAGSFPVRWVTAKVQDPISRRALARFAVHLFGARGTAYLSTEAGADRLR